MTDSTDDEEKTKKMFLVGDILIVDKYAQTRLRGLLVECIENDGTYNYCIVRHGGSKYCLDKGALRLATDQDHKVQEMIDIAERLDPEILLSILQRKGYLGDTALYRA